MRHLDYEMFILARYLALNICQSYIYVFIEVWTWYMRANTKPNMSPVKHKHLALNEWTFDDDSTWTQARKIDFQTRKLEASNGVFLFQWYFCPLY